MRPVRFLLQLTATAAAALLGVILLLGGNLLQEYQLTCEQRVILIIVLGIVFVLAVIAGLILQSQIDSQEKEHNMLLAKANELILNVMSSRDHISIIYSNGTRILEDDEKAAKASPTPASGSSSTTSSSGTHTPTKALSTVEKNLVAEQISRSQLVKLKHQTVLDELNALKASMEAGLLAAAMIDANRERLKTLQEKELARLRAEVAEVVLASSTYSPLTKGILPELIWPSYLLRTNTHRSTTTPAAMLSVYISRSLGRNVNPRIRAKNRICRS
jgi:hypothetical protein